MDNNTRIPPASENVDNLLAEFADRVIDGKQSEIPEVTTQIEELRDLQEVVVSIKQAFGDRQPDEEMAKRIRANLAAEWRRAGLDVPAVPIWQRLWQQIAGDRSTWRSTSARRRSYALVLAGAAAVILLVALPLYLSSPTGETVTGAAGTVDSLIPVIVVLGFVLVGGVVWWMLSRRK